MEGENTQAVGTVESSTPETTPTMDAIVDSFGEENNPQPETSNTNDVDTTDDNAPSGEQDNDTEKTDEQDNTEDKPFDPDNVDFESEDEDKPIYKDIEGYDLEAYKDILDFDGEESMAYIKGELAELKNLGFNQAQMEKYVNSHIKSYQEQQAEEAELRSEKHIKQKLNDQLTKEEKGNYKAILNWVRELSNNGAFPKEWVSETMSNAKIVKMFNSMYKSNTSNNKVQEVPNPTPKAVMSVKDAFNKYKDWIIQQKGASREKTTEFVESMRPYIADKDMEHFNEIFKSVVTNKK